MLVFSYICKLIKFNLSIRLCNKWLYISVYC